MKIVNTVSKGTLSKSLDLATIATILKHPQAVKITHQTKQPEQLLIKFASGNTMIIFKTGSFRMMGKDDSLDAHFNIYEIIAQFSGQVPEVTTQNMTVCHNFEHRINLSELTKESIAIYTAEHFPAVQIRLFHPIHINIFSSGKVTLTGVKDESELPILLTF